MSGGLQILHTDSDNAGYNSFARPDRNEDTKQTTARSICCTANDSDNGSDHFGIPKIQGKL